MRRLHFDVDSIPTYGAHDDVTTTHVTVIADNAINGELAALEIVACNGRIPAAIRPTPPTEIAARA